MPETEFKGTPFREAIDFFQSKVRVPTRAYTDLMNEAHTRAFMVASAMKDDLLSDLQRAVGRAFTEGGTLEEFRKEFDDIVAKHGWPYKGTRAWRTRTIYDTNVRTAYSAGHWQQMQATKELRPYGRYTHGPSLRPREQHLAWDGMVVPLDDPWWDYRWPPNGWGCKCSVASVSDRDLERNGWEVSHPKPEETVKVQVNTPDGPLDVETVPGVDPSFAYNPGKSATGIKLSPRGIDENLPEEGGKWRPIPWGSKSMETWESMGRPREIPVDAPRAKFAVDVNTKEDLRPILEEMLGGKELFDTVDGAKVLLTVEKLMHIDPERSAYVPLIPEVLADPYEVWMILLENREKGNVELRKVYVKAVHTEEEDMNFFMVVQALKGDIVGWTFVPTSHLKKLSKVRRGKLLWARD